MTKETRERLGKLDPVRFPEYAKEFAVIEKEVQEDEPVKIISKKKGDK